MRICTLSCRTKCSYCLSDYEPRESLRPHCSFPHCAVFATAGSPAWNFDFLWRFCYFVVTFVCVFFYSPAHSSPGDWSLGMNVRVGGRKWTSAAIWLIYHSLIIFPFLNFYFFVHFIFYHSLQHSSLLRLIVTKKQIQSKNIHFWLRPLPQETFSIMLTLKSWWSKASRDKIDLEICDLCSNN